MKVAVIGGGLYGAHIARKAKEVGAEEVILLEKNPEIFTQLSSNFGVRLHAGPHYPRSPETRKSCREGFDAFYREYPELINEHEYSVYALGALDAEQKPPKVNPDEFGKVCQEFKYGGPLNLPETEYTNLLSAANIHEPSVIVGSRLRDYFREALRAAGVEIICNFEVKTIDKFPGHITISDGHSSIAVDRVINATSYQSLLPLRKPLPLDMTIVYQACLALKYRDKQPAEKPFSFIVMDGWFPCVMPYDDRTSSDSLERHYILTHGKWTILDSCETPEKAQNILDQMYDTFVETQIKPKCEESINSFWPNFAERFEYCGWKGGVLAKVRTNTEFRSAVTFEDDRIVYVIPGKVSNIFNAADEAISLIQDKDIICDDNGYRYVRGGTLDSATNEVIQPIEDMERNTCQLKTVHNLSSFWQSPPSPGVAKPNSPNDACGSKLRT